MLSCFCGCRLSTAGIVVGWIYAGWAAFVILLGSIGLANLDKISNAVATSFQKAELNQDVIKFYLLFLFCVMIVMSIIEVVASLLLVTGTVKENHLMLLPWLVNDGFSWVCGVSYSVRLFFRGISDGTPFGALFIFLLLNGALLGFFFYIWYAIYSLYKQLKAKRQMQHQMIPTATLLLPSQQPYKA